MSENVASILVGCEDEAIETSEDAVDVVVEASADGDASLAAGLATATCNVAAEAPPETGATALT